MSSNKSLALALCLSITGCAQTPQNDSDGSHWWSFGSSDKVASKDAVQSAAKPATAAATTSVKAPAAPAVDAQAKAATAAVPTTAKADSGSHWWWPFDSQPAKAPTKEVVKDIPMPDPKITQAWLDDYEPRVRTAIKDSHLQLERRENVLVIVVPADESFNPKRPNMLMPSTLGPFSRVAKLVEGDMQTSVLVLGHTDATGTATANQELSKERAQSVAAIFSLSGIQRERLMLRGMGGVMPRAANDSAQGRALNRRVEIMLTPRSTMLALLNKYSQPTPPAAEMVTVHDVKPAPAVTAKKATSAKKGTKKAVAKKPAAKKHPAKKASSTKAAAPEKAASSTDQSKN